MFWEANRCADALARNGSTMEEEFCIFDLAPNFIKEFLCSDVRALALGNANAKSKENLEF